MRKNKTEPSPLDRFQTLLGYGSFRPHKDGYEVRVKDLDTAFNQAVDIINKNNLPLVVYGRDIRLRSFLVAPSREEVCND